MHIRVGLCTGLYTHTNSNYVDFSYKLVERGNVIYVSWIIWRKYQVIMLYNALYTGW